MYRPLVANEETGWQMRVVAPAVAVVFVVVAVVVVLASKSKAKKESFIRSLALNEEQDTVTRAVTSAYETILMRGPPGEAESIVRSIMAVKSGQGKIDAVHALQKKLSGSAEAKALATVPPATRRRTQAMVTRMFVEYGSRRPSDLERTRFLNLAGKGSTLEYLRREASETVSHGSVETSFRVLMDRQFVDNLYRGMNQLDWETWSPKMVAGMTAQELRAALRETSEYKALAGVTTYGEKVKFQKIIDGAYRTPPSTEQRAKNILALSNGMTAQRLRALVAAKGA